MDYFSKFKKRIIPPKAQPTSQMQVLKFHKSWDYIHNIFIAEDRKVNLHVKQTEIPETLRQMVDILVDEEARQEENTTGQCMEYLLKHAVLEYLVNWAEKADYPEGIRGESIRTIASMVDLLDDRFLVHNAVHKPTIQLLRFCVLDERQSELDHEDLVDLMYIICSKIHGFPALLNIFFHDKQWLTTPQKTLLPPIVNTNFDQEAVIAVPEYEFLLFTYLLRFVHREGKSGDFARTGLLFLMEMATDQLGDFILDSDFAAIMAAGLGALYSQLPRKLIIKDETEINSNPASFLLGQDWDPRAFPSDQEFGVEQSDSAQFKYQLDSFLKLLEFCQDILMRCPNDAISKRLLLSIRDVFLENILDASILHCAPYDGSSVAVVSYIDLILQTVQQPDLAGVILGFLMDANDELVGGLITQCSKSPLYNLKDLIFDTLNSTSQTAVIATLRLLKTLIWKHCRFADRLLSTCPILADDVKPPSTTISHHIREIELYFQLISAIDKVHADDILTLGYQDYLCDIEDIMQHDICFQQNTTVTGKQRPSTPLSSKSEKRRSFKYGQRSVEAIASPQPIALRKRERHLILPTDDLIQALLRLLSHFFAQSSELNLALTGVISALAMCPYRSLEGWISFNDQDRTSADGILNLTSAATTTTTLSSHDGVRADEIYALNAIEEQEREQGQDDDQSVDFGVERNSIRMTAPTHFKSLPPFYTLFRTLTQQVDYYRSEVNGFDKLLDERWHGLFFGETSLTSMTTATPLSTNSTTRRGSIFGQGNNSSNSNSSSSSSSTNHSIATTSPNTSKLFSYAGSNNTNKGRSSISLLKSSVSSSTVTAPTISSTATSSNNTPHNPSKSLSSSITSAVMANNSNCSINIMTPSISTGTTTAIIIPASKSTVPVINPLTPLALHTQRTIQVRVQSLFPSDFEIEREEPILHLDEEDQHTFAPKFTTPSQRKKKNKSTEISLSMLLNNVVILEESIKELVAIMQVRRSLGIDRIRYT